MHESNTIESFDTNEGKIKGIQEAIPFSKKLSSKIFKCWITPMVGKKSQMEILLYTTV